MTRQLIAGPPDDIIVRAMYPHMGKLLPIRNTDLCSLRHVTHSDAAQHAFIQWQFVCHATWCCDSFDSYTVHSNRAENQHQQNWSSQLYALQSRQHRRRIAVGLCQLDRLAYNSSMQHATDQSNRFTFYHPPKPPLELSPIWVLPPHRAQESHSTGEATGGTLSMVAHTKPARASQRPLTTTTKLCQPILPLPQHRQERPQLDGVPDPDIDIIDNHTTHVTLTRSLTSPSHARDQQLCTTLYYGQHTIVTTPLTIIHPISPQGSAHNTCRTASES